MLTPHDREKETAKLYFVIVWKCRKIAFAISLLGLEENITIKNNNRSDVGNEDHLVIISGY